MKLFKVTLRGSVEFDDIEADDEGDAYAQALVMAEQYMIHDILDEGDVEEIKNVENLWVT